MMFAAVVFAVFGIVLLVIAVVVSNGPRKNRLEVRRLKNEVSRMTDQLRTPEEREAEARRIEAIEANNREVHERFDSGGC